jgi:hypothetical protein
VNKIVKTAAREIWELKFDSIIQLKALNGISGKRRSALAANTKGKI